MRQLEAQINSLHQGLHCKSVGVIHNHWAIRKAEYQGLNADLHLSVTGSQTSQKILCFSHSLQENNYTSHTTEHSVKHVLLLKQGGKKFPNIHYDLVLVPLHCSSKCYHNLLKLFLFISFKNMLQTQWKLFRKFADTEEWTDHYENVMFSTEQELKNTKITRIKD